ncbi:MAG: Ig-like domain-containing protein [Trueperaceae bacterium]|nr:MAG: Ig-like domain-containing protein [Trueperaceae bacterium]
MRRTAPIVLALLAAGLLAACGAPPPPTTVTGVDVSPDAATIEVDETVTLSATVQPTGASQSVSWESNTPSVATVDTSGVVTGVSEGAAEITATSSADTSHAASATVTVVSDEDVVTVDCDAATPLSDDITEATTLPLDCYLVTTNVTVSAALTLLPGAVLEFETSSGMRVADGGSLNADGTSVNPITFRSQSGDSDDWRGVGIFTSSDDNVLDNVLIENAGMTWSSINGNNATNLYLGPAGRAAITNSTFRTAGNDGVGVYVEGRASEFIALENNRFDDNEAAAMRVTSHQLGQIGSGNEFDVDDNALPGAKHIRVASDEELRSSATWPATDVPYRFVGNHVVGDPGAVITIEAGATLEFDTGAGLAVDTGALRAEGSDTAPVTFTSASGNPDDWRGVGIFSSSDQNLFDHAAFENAGMTWSSINGNNATNLFVGPNGEVAITNSTFATAGNDGVGLYVDAGSSVLSAFEGNTFDANESAAMRVTSHQLGSIGAGNVFSQNALPGAQHIQVTDDGDLVSSATWRAVDVPYRFSGNHVVDDPGAVITVDPGVTLEFETSSGMRVDSGALSAVGTSDDRIVFTSATGDPNGWRGLGISSNSADNALDFVTMENAGQTWSSINGNNATNLFVDAFSRVAVTNSAFNDSGGWGIYIEEDGEVTDAAGTSINPLTEGDNTFTNNTEGDVRLP